MFTTGLLTAMRSRKPVLSRRMSLTKSGDYQITLLTLLHTCIRSSYPAAIADWCTLVANPDLCFYTIAYDHKRALTSNLVSIGYPTNVSLFEWV